MLQDVISPQTVPHEHAGTTERLSVVIAGHVDHGKSTIIGRLLADTGSLPDGKLEQVRRNCRLNARGFEYAFLLDALKDEQAQGITIDAARVFFRTPKRRYVIIDAPGHIEFLRNMVTGASRAEAALLVVDAEQGLQENSYRHGYMIAMLGIKQLVVLVNKMDLVNYDRSIFETIARKYQTFLADINLAANFIPVSGIAGDNVASASDKMPWYNADTVGQALDNFTKEAPSIDKPFRMPVQDIYKFTRDGDKRRIVVGTIDAGTVQPGDELIFYPSCKHSRVKTLEVFNRPPLKKAVAGQAAAFTLDKQIYIARGEIAAKKQQPPPMVSGAIHVSLFWMGKQPMRKNKSYLIKVGTAKQPVRLEKVIRIIDVSNPNAARKKDYIGYHDVGECILRLRRAVAFDLVEHLAATSRFVIVDNYEITGGGIIRQALPDKQLRLHRYVMTRNFKWETSSIAREDRAEKYNQKPTLILITGRKNVGKKTFARAIEERLFADGKIVYFLGIGNILYGVDADIKTEGSNAHRSEHLRRLAEVANVMLDAGVILVVTAVGLTAEDLDLIRAAVDTDSINVIWVGNQSTDIPYNLLLPNPDDLPAAVEQVKTMLQENGIIFKP